MSQQKRKIKEVEVQIQTGTSTAMTKNNTKEIEKEEALFNAAESGDCNKIVELLSLGVSVEGENYEKGLHHFCKNHHMTPLLVAVANGHVKCVQTLIAYGANVDAKDKFGATALHLVTEKGSYEGLITLLAAGANPSMSTKMSSYKRKSYVGGTTPLHLAAKSNNVKFIEVLIQFGADCNAVNEKGHTSLYVATKAGFEECALSILRNSKNPDILFLPSFDSSETPLHYAVEHRMVQCIKEMVLLGSDVNHISKYGYSPLHLFLYSHREKSDLEMEILKLLVVDGYNININAATKDGKTPLDISLLSISWDPEFTEFLVSFGGKSNEMSTQTFLQYLLAIPRSHSLLKCIVRTMPQLPRLKSIFSTPLIDYLLNFLFNFDKISRGPYNTFVEVIDHEVISIELGSNFINEPVTKYVKYPLEQPFLDVIYNCLIERLENFDNEPLDENHDYYKKHFIMLKHLLWYDKIASLPPSLQHCCRLSVRKCLGPSKLKLITKLPIPEKLISYLALKSEV